MEEDWDLPAEMPPVSTFKIMMVPPEHYSEILSIVKEVAEKHWWSADWPMNCRLCDAPYGEHEIFCLAKRAREVLEGIK